MSDTEDCEPAVPVWGYNLAQRVACLETKVKNLIDLEKAKSGVELSLLSVGIAMLLKLLHIY